MTIPKQLHAKTLLLVVTRYQSALRSVKRKHVFHKLFAANTYLNAPFAAPKMTYGCYRHVYMVTDGCQGLAFSHLPQSDDCPLLYQSYKNSVNSSLLDRSIYGKVTIT